MQRLFLEVDGKTASECATVLDRACEGAKALRREVESMLHAAEGNGDFLDAAHRGAATGVTAAGELAVGNERIGPNEIIRKIGDGGMGAVCLARRADQQFEKQVAIKLPRGGRIAFRTVNVETAEEPRRVGRRMLRHQALPLGDIPFPLVRPAWTVMATAKFTGAPPIRI